MKVNALITVVVPLDVDPGARIEEKWDAADAEFASFEAFLPSDASASMDIEESTEEEN